MNNISLPKEGKNIYISYTINPSLRKLNTHFILNNCLFGSAKLTKNADLDKYKYKSYSIGFDPRLEILFKDGSMRRNVIIFTADMSSSVHINNKKKDISILGPTQQLDGTISTAETKYPINFPELRKRFVLILHYSGRNSFLFVNATKIYQFKVKNSGIKHYALCLGNMLKDFMIL